MKGKVCGFYVAIKPRKVEKVSAGGIVLAEDFDPNKEARVQAAEIKGTVIDVGRTAYMAYDYDKPDWKPWCEIGDSVYFKRHTAKIIEDYDDLDDDGKPTKIFVTADENVTWNEGKADD